MEISKTFHQLYWDKEFVEKRIKEQKIYLYTLSWKYYHKKTISFARLVECGKSAYVVLKRFERQLELINKLK